MEESRQNTVERKNELTKLLFKENINITVLDLSHTSINNIDCIDFPPNLVELDLSNNNLESVPTSVLDLKCIKILNVAFNRIKYFDEIPEFCDTIEIVNLSNNELHRPPYWVWAGSPKNLVELDISENIKIRNSLNASYLNELLQYKTALRIIKMHNCRFSEQFELLQTFANAKILDMSSKSLISANVIDEFPIKGLDKCCNIENLNLCRTWLTTIHSNIKIYKNLIEINLSNNNISEIPNEFCKLEILETCILSYNSIMYLPNDIVKLKKLAILCLDGNKLTSLPDICELKNLIKLDVYDNYLYDAPEVVESVQELDFALNYFDEPQDDDYKEKKSKLRSQTDERSDKRKYEKLDPESDRSVYSEDDLSFSEEINAEENNDATNRPLSSPEDWDSDDFWVPHYPRQSTPSEQPWLLFVKRKMAEGNFCPMDLHPISVAAKVQYEKLCNPIVIQECEGQFDDYSSDDS